ncbi:hypothetical protein TWF281_010723 [Arthrobotrys megalospora]
MAVRNFLRYLLLTPVQLSIFLLISLPLALFAAITTFFSVMFLSSRLLLVYVDLVVSVVFASSSSSPRKDTSTTAAGRGGIKLNTSRHGSHHPHPLIIPRSPPRSPPRSGSSGWKTQPQRGYYQQSFTAPSSPNIGRKRMALSSGFYQQQQQQVVMPSEGGSNSGSPPLVMKGFGKGVGGKGSSSTPYPAPGTMAPPPPPYRYEANGGGRGKRGPVVVVEPGEEDYFTGGTED